MSNNALTLMSLAIVALVLIRDLGHRQVTLFALIRPLVAAAVIIPFVSPGWDFQGNGLLLEIGALVLGALLGLAAFACMKVSVDADGRAWTDAGAPYAIVWILITAARQAFIYGAQHWFTRDLGRFIVDNHISIHAFADSILFLSLAPVMANRLAILIRSRIAAPARSQVTAAA